MRHARSARRVAVVLADPDSPWPVQHTADTPLAQQPPGGRRTDLSARPTLADLACLQRCARRLTAGRHPLVCGHRLVGLASAGVAEGRATAGSAVARFSRPRGNDVGPARSRAHQRGFDKLRLADATHLERLDCRGRTAAGLPSQPADVAAALCIARVDRSTVEHAYILGPAARTASLAW